jgi:hypothetical protein
MEREREREIERERERERESHLRTFKYIKLFIALPVGVAEIGVSGPTSPSSTHIS